MDDRLVHALRLVMRYAEGGSVKDKDAIYGYTEADLLPWLLGGAAGKVGAGVASYMVPRAAATVASEVPIAAGAVDAGTQAMRESLARLRQSDFFSPSWDRYMSHPYQRALDYALSFGHVAQDPMASALGGASSLAFTQIPRAVDYFTGKHVSPDNPKR